VVTTIVLYASVCSGWLYAQDDPARVLREATATTDRTGAQQTEAATPDVSEAEPGHSAHGPAFNSGPRQAASLMSGTGVIDFPITTSNPQAQAFFNQGMGQFHGYWELEAERSFRQAAALDPNCAMAYWGMALANYWADDRARGWAFVREAQRRQDLVSPRERRWIQILADYYDPKITDWKVYKRNLFRGLEELIDNEPNNIEARAILVGLICEGWFTWAPTKYRSVEAQDGLLDRVFELQPLHPAHHYRLHLADYGPVNNELESARKCGLAAPAIPHMWHMPVHAYRKIPRYDLVLPHLELSCRLEHAHMARVGVMPDQIHNYGHNQDYLLGYTYAVGQTETAFEVAKNLMEIPRHPDYNRLSRPLSTSATGRRALTKLAIDYEMWEQVLELDKTPYLDWDDDASDQIDKLRLMGLVQVNLGSNEQLIKTLSKLAEIREASLQAGDSGRKRIKQVDQTLSELSFEQLRHAGDFEAAKGKLGELGHLSKSRQALLAMQVGDLELADKLSKAAVEEWKKTPLATAIRVLVLAKRQDFESAKAMFEELRQVSGEIEDMSLRTWKRLQPLAEEFGYSADWRVQPTDPPELEGLPDFETSGPFLWRPFEASPFQVTNLENCRVQSTTLWKRPTVVLLYLGMGCLHCVEQLQAFIPEAESFAEVGIDIVAIGTDPVPELKTALERFGPTNSIRFYSDPELEAFHALRAYDDFEKMPLHGTYLIDRCGAILWQDMGAEPFVDTRFLLKEAVRMLELQEYARKREARDAHGVSQRQSAGSS
jgi:peroxiredoxin